MTHAIDSVFNAQFDDSQEINDYSDLLAKVWKSALLDYVSWFSIQYYNTIRRACLNASTRSNREQDCDDLIQDTILQLYKSVDTYDPERGELIPRLVYIAKIYPIRRSIELKQGSIRHFSGYVDDHNSEEDQNQHGRDYIKNIPAPVESIASIEAESTLNMLRNLQPWEKHLLSAKLVAGMSNVAIAKAMGCSEAAIRWRLNQMYDRIKVRGKHGGGEAA
jgi:RNA polymerase sigma factor (sigma-70 family)